MLFPLWLENIVVAAQQWLPAPLLVYAARCTDPSAMRPIGYVLLLLLAVALAFSASRLGAQR